MRSWRNAPRVRENMYTRHEISAEEHQAWWRQVQQSDTCRYFMYEFDKVPMGIVCFTDINPVSQQANWGYYTAVDAPRGVGVNMELLSLDYAFDMLNLHKLSCEVLAFNTAVIKLHQKFGFKVEGVFREHHKVGDDFVDIHRLGMLASEWREQRPKMLSKLERVNRKWLGCKESVTPSES